MAFHIDLEGLLSVGRSDQTVSSLKKEGPRCHPIVQFRRLDDFLKELKLTEGHTTGLTAIKKAMQQNGSPEPPATEMTVP
ncbi:MAG: hypothetical protein PHY99_08140 [Bacteroidales bacterium]|nr:hypothetical protein [Bacteroidales bacterium]